PCALLSWEGHQSWEGRLACSFGASPRTGTYGPLSRNGRTALGKNGLILLKAQRRNGIGLPQTRTQVLQPRKTARGELRCGHWTSMPTLSAPGDGGKHGPTSGKPHPCALPASSPRSACASPSPSKSHIGGSSGPSAETTACITVSKIRARVRGAS